MALLSLFVNGVRRFPPRRRTRMLTGRCGCKNALPRMTVAKPLSPEIISQALGLGMRICQPDVAVRPNEIDCRAQQPSSPHSRLPREDVQRQSKFAADFG